MPWYYAGLDTKPVGPISLDELHARRMSGAVTPDTYVIEYVGAPGDARQWKRYADIFPAQTTPPLAPVLPPPPFVAPTVPPVQSHPLFPSAASATVRPVGPVSLPGHPPIPHGHRSNPWCVWGFGLGLGSLILLLPSCGLTAFVAIPAAFVSIMGIIKVQHDTTQGGRNLAWSGLALSAATIVLIVILLIFAVPAILKGRALITTTEQSTNDSE
jgi:hypothetical protein